MFEQKLGEFTLVPYSAVTMNGHYLARLNTEEEPTAFALIAPNKKAVDGEDNSRPYRYTDMEQVYSDLDGFKKYGYSTCP